jgi:hypothetical protein
VGDKITQPLTITVIDDGEVCQWRKILLRNVPVAEHARAVNPDMKAAHGSKPLDFVLHSNICDDNPDAILLVFAHLGINEIDRVIRVLRTTLLRMFNQQFPVAA